MRKTNDAGKSNREPEILDDLQRRMQRIRDRLDQADRIFDNLDTKQQKKPDKAADIFDEIFESIERGFRKLFNTLSSGMTKPEDKRDQQRSMIRENLTHYLLSCSDEQLEAIRSEIDRILEKRGSRN